MDPSEQATMVKGRGIEGNANQGGKRQVTIISKEMWEKLMDEVGGDQDPASRRANLMVSGVDLSNIQGPVIAIGNVRIRIHGESRPCERMEEAQPGLKTAMEAPWRGGAFGGVLDDGTISVGDPVEWRT